MRMEAALAATLVLLLAVAGTPARAEDSCSTVESVEDACDLQKGLIIYSLSARITLDDDVCNETYNKQDWQHLPRVSFPEAKPDIKYAVLMIDPDAINTPKGQNYWHWLAANIPGSELKTGDWSKDYDLLKYKGPGPPEGTGLHRYQFVLFEYRDSKRNLDLKLSNENRRQFHLGNWLRSVSDKVQLCGPVAAIQFLSQY